MRCFAVNSKDLPLQDPTITHQLFRLIVEMSEDEKRTLLKLLKGGALKAKCRRQRFRKSIRVPVRITSKAGHSSGFMQSISLGGAFIVTRSTYSIEDSLAVGLAPPGFGRTVWIAGDVVRVTPEGIGVRFRSMSDMRIKAVISVASGN
jgi:Tfp pilus assembly protein PilZ